VHFMFKETKDESECPGPLKYYKSLDCTPVYKNPTDRCPESYDCSHLTKLSKDKCYVNGHEYSINETLREEDANPCDIGCRCLKSYSDDVAVFICAIVDCFHGSSKPGCFFRRSPNLCCAGEEVCMEDKERATCEVDGKVYKDGDHFEIKSDPELSCYCMPGYKGENVEPFCKRPNHDYCSPLFRYAANVYNGCAPVYYDTQNPRTSCSAYSRCPNENDTIIRNHDSSKSIDTDESKTCRFGDMIMNIGDELNEGTDYSSNCMKCVCEVPPVPTCQRRPYNEC
ncbi:hypothetical protein WN55_02163, partial [Dufourea novaeangliae]